MATEGVGERLHAIADAKHRLAGVQDVVRNLRRIRLINRSRSARQDKPLWFESQDLFGGGIVREELTVNVGFTNSSGDELGVLRAEIKDN